MEKFTGLQYILIDIASHFGLDKQSWQDRIHWTLKNEHKLHSKISSAENPAQFHAAIQALKDAREGKPSGYPISLDATASGMQLLSCLVGDESAAKLSNVIDTGEQSDAYQAIYNIMVDLIGNDANIERSNLKQAIMTSLYGSQAKPKEIFGSNVDTFIDIMLDKTPGVWKLNETMLEIWNPDATEYSWIMPDNFHVICKVMDKEEVEVDFLGKPYMVTRNVNKAAESGRSLCANLTHSIDGMVVREVLSRCNHNAKHVTQLLKLIGRGVKTKSTKRDKDKTLMSILSRYESSGFLSARIIDFIDEENIGLVAVKPLTDLLLSLPEYSFQVISVHDCFRVLPNYGNDLRQQYNNILAEIANSNMLGYLIPQIAGEAAWTHLINNFRPIANHLSEDMHTKIKDANYSLT